MRDRKGNWQDLLASHSLAVDTKKLWLGFVATLASVALLTIIGAVYSHLIAHPVIGYFNLGAQSFVSRLTAGQGIPSWTAILPLFNPFAAGISHFALSIFLYIGLFAIWSYCGGAISRLTALQYGRDDIPTLSDGLDMVRDKRNAYFFAPLTPLFGIVIFAVCNMVLGLICSIPYIGPWITAISVPFVALPAAIITTFIVVLGVTTFGLMFPAVSIGGKDAFEGWSSAYSYLLWGFNRFVGYTLIAAIVGSITTLIAVGVAELFIGILVKTISIGLIGGSIMQLNGVCSVLKPVGGGSVGMSVASGVTMIIAVLARTLVVAYVFSFFFTANTIICFLLRKHVDRIEIDEVYEESPEEETFEEEFEEAPPETQPTEEETQEAPESVTEDVPEAEGEKQEEEQDTSAQGSTEEGGEKEEEEEEDSGEDSP